MMSILLNTRRSRVLFLRGEIDGGPTAPTYEEYYDISYFYFPASLV